MATTAEFGYARIVAIFDTDETAGSFLREDGEGGFASGVYRMAREIERLRAALMEAKRTIKALHGPVAWDIYDQRSPEMKIINGALGSPFGHSIHSPSEEQKDG